FDSSSAQNQIEVVCGEHTCRGLADSGGGSGNKGCSLVHVLLKEQVNRHGIHRYPLQRRAKRIVPCSEHVKHTAGKANLRGKFKQRIVKIKTKTCLKAEIESLQFKGSRRRL